MKNKKIELPPEPEKLFMIQRGDEIAFYRWDQAGMRYIEINAVNLGTYAGKVYDAARAKRLRFFI